MVATFVVVALAAVLMVGVASAFADAPAVVGPPEFRQPQRQFPLSGGRRSLMLPNEQDWNQATRAFCRGAS